MHGVIVDLDRSRAVVRTRPADRLAICALILGCVVFGLVVWTARPTARPSAPAEAAVATGASAPTFAAAVPRGVVLRPLLLPSRYANVDLAAMPDRLANEAPLWTLRSVVIIRGTPGVASVEGPAVILWTENGIAYSLQSPTRTTVELIRIANDLR